MIYEKNLTPFVSEEDSPATEEPATEGPATEAGEEN